MGKAQKEAIVSQAIEKTRAAHAAAGHRSKRSQRGSIRDNRIDEKERESNRNIWVLGGGTVQASNVGETTLISSESAESDDGYVPPSSQISRIDELLKDTWGKDEK